MDLSYLPTFSIILSLAYVGYGDLELPEIVAYNAVNPTGI